MDTFFGCTSFYHGRLIIDIELIIVRASQEFSRLTVCWSHFNENFSSLSPRMKGRQ